MSDPFKNKTNSPQSLKHFYTQSTEDVNKGLFKHYSILEMNF
jgi:hypothetical protein